MGLFDHEYGEDESPIIDPGITQVIFYFGEEDAKYFKRLAKEGMKVEFKDYINDGNISDLLLMILKRNYDHLLTKKTFDAAASGSPTG